jgi:hypothetical protein
MQLAGHPNGSSTAGIIAGMTTVAAGDVQESYSFQRGGSNAMKSGRHSRLREKVSLRAQLSASMTVVWIIGTTNTNHD